MTLETLVPFVPVLIGIAALLVSMAMLGLREMMSPGVTHFAVLLLGFAAFTVAVINFSAYAATIGLLSAIGYVLIAAVAGVLVPFAFKWVNGALEESRAATLMEY